MKISFETARLRLARLQLDARANRRVAAEHIARIGANALQIDRLGVWTFMPDEQALRSVALFRRETATVETGAVWNVAGATTWLAQLKAGRAVVVGDVAGSTTVTELQAEYLKPNRIESFVHVSLIRNGTVVGVVTCEVVGQPRAWNQREVDFCASVADAVVAMLEQADRLELEAELQRQRESKLVAEKMKALERMASGVTHELKNLLAVVRLEVERLRREMGLPAEQALTVISEAAVRATELTRQLSQFGDGTQAESESDITDAVTRLKPTFERLKGNRLFVQTIEANEPLKIRAPRVELEQAVMNLFFNAVDATNETQGITMRLRRALVDGTPSAILEVSDGGSGMPEEVQARIFEPYFTTKPNGTGFGLASVYGMVKRAGGIIDVESEPNRGTSFRLQFPIAAAPRSTRDSVWDYPGLPQRDD